MFPLPSYPARRYSDLPGARVLGAHALVGADLLSRGHGRRVQQAPGRSEEHTSELQSHSDLVCRLLLEKKKEQKNGGVRRHAHCGLDCEVTSDGQSADG